MEAWHERTKRDESNAQDEQEEQREEAPREKLKDVKPRSAIRRENTPTVPLPRIHVTPVFTQRAQGPRGLSATAAIHPFFLLWQRLHLKRKVNGRQRSRKEKRTSSILPTTATVGAEEPTRLGRVPPTESEGAGREETRGAASVPEPAEGGPEETGSMGEGEAAGTGEPPAGEREEGRDGAGRVGDGAADGPGRVGDGTRGSATPGENAKAGPDTAEEVAAGGVTKTEGACHRRWVQHLDSSSGDVIGFSMNG